MFELQLLHRDWGRYVDALYSRWELRTLTVPASLIVAVQVQLLVLEGRGSARRLLATC